MIKTLIATLGLSCVATGALADDSAWFTTLSANDAAAREASFVERATELSDYNVTICEDRARRETADKIRALGAIRLASKNPKLRDEADNRIAAVVEQLPSMQAKCVSAAFDDIATRVEQIRNDYVAWSNNEPIKTMISLRVQIQRCWNVPDGVSGMRVSVKFNLDQSGSIKGDPEIIGSDGALAESARRAVLKCAPYNLPAERYAEWSSVIVSFDP